MFNLSEQLADLRDSIIIAVLLVLAAVIGIGWISLGVLNFAQIQLGPVWGPVALGAAMIVPLIIYIVVKRVTKDQKKRQQELLRKQTQSAYAQSSIVHIQRILDALKGRSPVLATFATVVAGILASRFPSVLAILAEFISAWDDDKKRQTAERDKD